MGMIIKCVILAQYNVLGNVGAKRYAVDPKRYVLNIFFMRKSRVHPISPMNPRQSSAVIQNVLRARIAIPNTKPI